MSIREFPLITTIIPTYRRKELLSRAIRSVLSQSYPHFQVCVYDNASCDGTEELVAAFTKTDPRVKYYCHKTPVSVVENFQYGLDHVQTPFFSILADDDLLLPSFYHIALKQFWIHPEASFFLGATLEMNEKKEIVHIPVLKWKDKTFYSAPEGLLSMIGAYSNWTGVLFRREVIDKVGALDPKIKAIDMDYLLRAAVRCSFIVSKVPCALFMQHFVSYSFSHRLEVLWPGWKLMIAKLQEEPLLPKELKEGVIKKLQNQLEKRLFRNALKEVLSLNIEKALEFVEVLCLCQKRPKKGLKRLIRGSRYFPLKSFLFPLLLFVRQKVRILSYKTSRSFRRSS